MELIGSDDTDTPRTAAKKKKSALSRFAARKKKGSDGESDYGSKGSLGLLGDDDSTRGSNIDFGARPSPSPRFNSSPRYGGVQEDDSNVRLRATNREMLDIQPSVGPGMSPRPENLLQYRNLDAVDAGYLKSYDKSGLTPVEYSHTDSHPRSVRTPSTPSENTIERFRSLNVEAGPSFDASFKGEKRNRDQNSSGEDVDPETGHIRKLTAGESVGVNDLSDYGRRPSPRQPSPLPNNGGFDYSAAAASASAAAAADGMDVDNDSDDSGNVDFGDTNNEILGMLEKHEQAEKAGTPDPFAAYMTKNMNNEIFEEDPETQEVHDQYRHLLTSTPSAERKVNQGERPWSGKPDNSHLSPVQDDHPFTSPQRLSNLTMTATTSFGSGNFDMTFSKTSRMLRASSQTRSAGQALDSMSQRSYTTVCSLPPISTKTARERLVHD
jgi:hypothetical protein